MTGNDVTSVRDQGSSDFSRRNRAEISRFWTLCALGAVYVCGNFWLHLLEAFQSLTGDRSGPSSMLEGRTNLPPGC